MRLTQTFGLFVFYLNFQTKIIKDPGDFKKAITLRTKVFIDQLKWVRGTRDVDAYDDNSIHFAVFSRFRNRILAYVRVMESKHRFMLEREFKPLIEGFEFKKNNSLELSRLALDETVRHTFKSSLIKFLLFRKIYRWAKVKDIRYWYLVVTKEDLKFWEKAFGAYQIGKDVQFSPGTTTVAACVDLKEAENVVRKKNPFLFKLYTVGLKLY